ncbi:MAG: GAF domain-containing protein [Acidobacteriota bacterium]
MSSSDSSRLRAIMVPTGEPGLHLAEILWRLAWEGRSGILVLVRGDVKREILVQEGMPARVRSNSPAETLARFLVDRKLVDPGDVAIRDALSISGEGRMISALAALGAARLPFLEATMREHVRHVIVAAFEGIGTNAFFQPGPPSPDHRPFPMDVFGLLRAGIERLPFEFLGRTLAAWGSAPLIRSRQLLAVIREVSLAPDERRTLRAIDDQTGLKDLVGALGLPLGAIFPILYLFRCTGLVHAKHETSMQLAPPKRRTFPLSHPEPPSLQEMLAQSNQAASEVQVFAEKPPTRQARELESIRSLLRADGYELDRPLGKGGWGWVLLARQERLGRVVAIKVLKKSGDDEDDSPRPLRDAREARSAARLNHPNIITVHDFRERPGVSYIVMEYVQGTTLAELVARHGALQEGDALRLVEDVVRALQHAHGEGILHRDVKPENIFVSEGRQVKLGDWGLAKPMAAIGGDITAAGHFVGTPNYMAPEQLRQGEIDGRADIYALGCTLYFLLAGRAPFSGGTAVEIIVRQLNEAAPDLLKLKPDLTEKTAALVNRALEKDPAARFQSATEMLEAIRDAQRSVQDRERRTAGLVALLQEVAVAANQAADVREVLQLALDRIAVHTGWPVGHCYLADETGQLASSGIWHLDDLERFGAFVHASQTIWFGPDAGRLGTALATMRPVWVEDVGHDPQVLRAPQSSECQLHAAVAVPVVLQDSVVCVLELFSGKPEEPDDTLLDVLVSIGIQLGRVVERGRAQAALRRGEAKFQELVENLPLVAVFLDRQGRVTFANAELQKLTRRDASEIVGADWFATFVPESERDARKAEFLVQIHEGRFPQHVETDVLTRDGEHRLVRWSHTVLRGADDRVIGAASVGEDVGEQRSRERERLAQATMARTAGFLEALPVGVLATDGKGAPLYANQKAQEILGRGVLPVAGVQDSAELYPCFESGTHRPYPADRIPIHRALGGNTAFVDDMEVRPPGKPPALLEVSACPVRDEAGNVAFAVATFVDVGERRRARRRLETQHLLARILADGRSVKETLPAILRTLCEGLDWDVGAFFGALGADLRLVELWHRPDARADAFLATTQAEAFAARDDLPGRVMRASSPLWIADVGLDDRLPRAVAAQGDGIRSSCAFPVKAGSKPVGVIELHSQRRQEPDDDMLRMLGAVGSHVGQFIVLRPAEKLVPATVDRAPAAAPATVGPGSSWMQRFGIGRNDPVTGIHDHRSFMARLREEVARASERSEKLALLLVNLDGVGELRRTHGAAMGDRLLREAAQVVCKHLRKADIPGRSDLDELGVILPQTDAGAGALLAERLKGGIAALEKAAPGGAQLALRAVIGIADRNDEVASAEMMLERARSALAGSRSPSRTSISPKEARP